MESGPSPTTSYGTSILNRKRERLHSLTHGWNKKVKWHKIVVIILCYLIFVSFYCCSFLRLIPIVEEDLIEAWTPAHNVSLEKHEETLFEDEEEAEKFAFNFEETIFMSANAVGIFLSGILGDRYEPRILASITLLMCSIMLIILGPFVEWFQIYNVYYYGVFAVILGISQGFAWPIVIGIISKWRRKESIGLTIGFLAGCQSIGQAVTRSLGDGYLEFGYEYVFLATASIAGSTAIIAFFGLVSSPIDLGYSISEESEDEEENVDEREGISIWKAILLPKVIAFSLCCFFVRTIDIEIFYLNDALYMVGEIVAAVLSGGLSDMFGRTGVVVVVLAASLLTLFVGITSTPTVTISSIVGIMITAAENLIVGAVASDIAKEHNVKAASTLTGVIAGVGAVGLIVGRLLTPLLKSNYDWKVAFAFFIGMNIMALLMLVRTFLKDIRKIFQERRQNRTAVDAQMQNTDSINTVS